MQVNLDTTRGVRVVGGTGWAVNGQEVVATGAELSQFYIISKVSSINSANLGQFIMPFDGTITSGKCCVTGNPGAETVLTVTVIGGAGNAGTFTIANGTASGTTDDYVDGAGTASATAGTKVTITSDGGASNDVDAYVTLVVTR